MYQFQKIKLVIWDLDETFWKGTISEQKVVVPPINKELIKCLTDIGVVNSICSKNDWKVVEEELKKQNLQGYFVFPSVNWEPKGNRVKQLIKDMKLRSENVLFLDDNHSNREEVRYFCPDILVAGPDIIPQLFKDASSVEKKDTEHKRLKQYKLLEEKSEQKKNYNSNEEFLLQSNIRVEIKKDCLDKLDRIHELLLRSNQLNFTKNRCSKEELEILLKDLSVESGYILVSDRFGDYGLVGFYAVKENSLLHFTFSCRTLGMGIEQYIYNILKRPQLEIVGEVISDLSNADIPFWINRDNSKEQETKMQIQGLQEHMVLVKGPCDLFQVYPYIAQTELFDTEFTYVVENGVTIESTGHTTHIVESIRLSDEQKRIVLKEVPFSDEGMYKNNIFKNDYKVVFISILQDANLGVYRRKETGERFAFLEYLHPITEPRNWEGFINRKYNCGGFKFTQEILEKFAEQYEFIGRNTPEQIVENLKYIRENLQKDWLLVIMLGGEVYYEKNSFPAYEDRHVVHKQINDAIRKYAEQNTGIRLMDVNKYLVDQSSFYDHFNHYIKPVYYKLAQEMVSIVNEVLDTEIKETSKLKMVQIRLKEILAPFYYKIRKLVK